MSRNDAAHALGRPPSSALGSWARLATPLGTFHVAAIDGAVVRTALPQTRTEAFLSELQERHPAIVFLESPDDPLLRQAGVQLEEYANGKRRDFQVPVRLEGTAFQKRVWEALQQIPFGQTRSYADIARQVGRPGAFRAVGQANHSNPVAPFIPCHRVVNTAGGLGGYGGGLDMKRDLLALEGVQLDR